LKKLSLLDWALKISEANPNFNSAVFPNTPLPGDANDYNYNIGYLSDPSGELASNGHLSDIGKLPNHPTFSNESVYAIGNPNAGRWLEPLHGDEWRYSNPSRGLFMAPEQEAYAPKNQTKKGASYFPFDGETLRFLGKGS
jgi:hypothetical protein